MGNETPGYHFPKSLLKCWPTPLEAIGCHVHQLPDRRGHQLWAINVGRAKVTLCEARGDIFVLDYSALFTGLGKTARLARAVEKILLASGAKIYGKPISTNYIYQVDILPGLHWLKHLEPSTINVQIDQSEGFGTQFLCGRFGVRQTSVAFSTGVAIDPLTESSTYFVTLDPHSTNRQLVEQQPILETVDLSLRHNGAKRLQIVAEPDIRNE